MFPYYKVSWILNNATQACNRTTWPKTIALLFALFVSLGLTLIQDTIDHCNHLSTKDDQLLPNDSCKIMTRHSVKPYGSQLCHLVGIYQSHPEKQVSLLKPRKPIAATNSNRQAETKNVYIFKLYTYDQLYMIHMTLSQRNSFHWLASCQFNQNLHCL